MKINLREDSVVIEGYVNAVERNSKPLPSRTGRFIERICKGAFGNALKKNRNVLALLNHDRNKVLGETDNGSLELEEDAIGLRARLETSDPEVVRDARNGDLVGWSFGYYDTPDGVEESVEDGYPLRKVKDMDLTEVSLLNRRRTPAYDGTLAIVRSDDAVEYLGEEMITPVDVKNEVVKPIDYSYWEREINEMKMRYNPNHDAKTGRFTTSTGGGSAGGGTGETGGSGAAGGVANSGSGSVKSTGNKEADRIIALSDDELAEEVRKNERLVEGRIGTTYKPFVKEEVNMAKVEERSGLKGADAQECVDLAESVYQKAAKVEPKITEDVVSTVKDADGQMYGLDFRMKQPTSMAGKIGADAKDDGKSYKYEADNIKDAIRYTAVLGENNFTDGYNKIKSDLESKGYVEIRNKNFYNLYRDGKSQQKAVQCVYQDPNGQFFELQFHTVNSQGAKEINHPLYEMYRAKTTSSDVQDVLDKKMKQIGTFVSDPPGVYDIKSHK